MKKTSQIMFFVLIAVVLLLLTGCGADVNQSVTFYRHEAWETDMSFSIDAETLALFSDPATLEAELDRAVQEAENMGAKASWSSRRQDTTLIFTVHAEGKGLETLKEIAFDNSTQLSATEVEGGRQLYFSHPASRDFLDASQYTFTLNGGNIISSNGQKIDDRTVQWINPSGRMEAVFTEKGRLSLGMLLLILALVAGAGSSSWFFWQKQGKQETAVFCATCGQTIAPQAQFCPKCGQKRQ